MKTIVNNLGNDQVSVNEIKDSDFIGINFDGEKNIVLPYSENKFVSQTLEETLSYSYWTRGSKKEYVEEALNQNNTKAYVFDSRKEMLEWLLNE